MRYAIISDIHANSAALRAILADASDCGVERTICLGDVVGYGPDPAGALETVYRRVHVCVAGNHDAAVCGAVSADAFTPFAARAAALHRKALSRDALAWLAGLPLVHEEKSPSGETLFACVHGDFSAPAEFFYIDGPEAAAPSFAARTGNLLFAGHTHEPAIFALPPGSCAPVALPPQDVILEPGTRYIVNPGSAGYPRGGTCRSTYCIFDSADSSIRFRSLPFDLEGYAAAMSARGFPEAAWMRERTALVRRGDVRGSVDFGKKKPLFAKCAAIAAAFVLAAAAGALALQCRLAGPRGKRAGAPVRPAAAEEVSGAESTACAAPPATAAPRDAGWVAVPGGNVLCANGGRVLLEAGGNGPVRAARTIVLPDGAGNVVFTVATGRRKDSRFTAFLAFRDASGRQIGETLRFDRKQSVNSRRVPIPDGAATAEVAVEFFFEGKPLSVEMLYAGTEGGGRQD